MTYRRKAMVVFGTRPEAIKMAPLVRAMVRSRDLAPLVVVTAQHRDMLDQVLRLFEITPDFDLNIIRHRQTLTYLTERALSRLSPVVEAERPELIVVQGDTTTTLVGALAAFYHQVPVVHLEAGLRTGDRYSPFPEEVNRRLTTQLASLHLAPTRASAQNLLREGVDQERIVVTGNTVIDALLQTVSRHLPYEDPMLSSLDADSRRVLLVTAHRRESWGAPMRSVGRALGRLAADDPDLVIVFPIHSNPVVREAITPFVSNFENVMLLEPVSYGSFCRLMSRADLILTDSGGVQEEGPSLGKPVLVTRETTERPEAVEAGTVQLVGTNEDKIVSRVRELLDDKDAYLEMANAVNPYGDGRATDRSLAAIRHFFGEGEPAEEFVISCPATRGALSLVSSVQ